MDKSTHEQFKRELFAPVMKSAEGDYIAVLSDNSIDRDDEFVAASCIEKLGKDVGYIAGLVDHENSVLKMVAEWVNRKVINLDGHTALVAEPRFFKSNPNAMIIQGMLDEGAKIGISIGAMVKDYDEVDGRRRYKELELLEASFVAVPSNRHGHCMALCKSYKNREDKEMELTQKDVDSAVEKAVKAKSDEFSKQMEGKEADIAKLNKDIVDAKESAEKAKSESDAKVSEAEKKAEDAVSKAKAAEEALEAEKKKSLEKMQYAKGDQKNAKVSEEDMEKAIKEGKLPVMRLE